MWSRASSSDSPAISTSDATTIISPTYTAISTVTVGLDYQLSPNFTFGMLTKTEHREFLELNRKEGAQKLTNLARLCNEILEPVRTFMGSALITSAFRCPALNTAIGGAKNSQHVQAEAADMEFTGATEGAPLREAFNKIAFTSTIQYSQIIFEFGQWIHMGLLNETLYPGKKLQKLIASTVNGKTVYTAVTKSI